MGHPAQVDTLIRVIRRYDVILIMEIRDSSQVAIYDLLALVNTNLPSNQQYSMTLSARLGRSSSKEQYAYLYRTPFEFVSAYVYDDSVNDYFEREPYVATFRYTDAQSVPITHTFSLIGIHTKPDDADAEIDHLVDVYDDAVTRTNSPNAILLGDFNADCSYVCSSCWSSIRLFTDPRFTFLIGDGADTTASSTDCAYDRIVVTASIKDFMQVANATVYRYDLVLGLNATFTKLVSDHYPVELPAFSAGPIPGPGDSSGSDLALPAIGAGAGAAVILSTIVCLLYLHRRRTSNARHARSDHMGNEFAALSLPPESDSALDNGSYSYADETSGDANATHSLPPNWVQYSDENGNPYYYNNHTHQSQWEIPEWN
jgi:Endonuclease/Exonuclease/phosphatase family/WW domain